MENNLAEFSLPVPEADGKVFDYWEDHEGNYYSTNRVVSNLSTYYVARLDTLVPGDSTTALQEVDLTDFFTYPNPVQNTLFVKVFEKSSNSISGYDITIYSLTGEKLYYSKDPGQPVDVSAYVSGLYVLQIGNEATKFIKK